MNRPSKIIRIFLCSTFIEFKRERNYLAEYVFPELRELCRKAGMVFRVVDLRWGISAQDRDDHQTIPICLSEIRKCQEQSPDLNFLVMAGMDYGSILAPSEISTHDWDLLMNDGGLDSGAQFLLKSYYLRDSDADGAPYRAVSLKREISVSDWKLLMNGGVLDLETRFLLEKCYLRDFNAEGSPYRLSIQNSELETRENLVKFRKKLKKLEKQIECVLPPAAERAQCGKHLTASVTELEIEQGLFSKEARPHAAIVAIRQTAHELPAYAKGPYRKPEKQAALRKRILVNSKKVTKNSGKMIICDKDDPDFARQIGNSLREAVINRIQAVQKMESLVSSLELEEEALAEELRRTASGYLDMTADLEDFSRFVKQNRGKAVLVTGEQGVGKTTFLKTWAYRNRAAAVFGDSQPSGGTVGHALGYLVAQFRRRGILPGTVGERVEDISIEQFAKLLKLAETGKDDSVTAVIDSVEQLQDYHMQKDSLFRIRVPEWLTLVISCISKDRLTREEQRRDIPTFSIYPFQSVASAEERLWKLLSGKGRKLTAGQCQLIRSLLPAQTTPLYLSILADMLYRQASYTPLPMELSDNPYLPASTRDMAAFLLVRQEYTPAPVLYWHTMRYLALSSDGLEETELLDLFCRDGQVLHELSPKWKSDWDRGRYILEVHWALMRGLLESILLEHEEQGVPLLRFRHDLERAAVLNYTPPSGGDYLETLARNLRNYFDRQDIYLRTGDGVAVNFRRVRELYPVLDFLGEYEKAVQMFSDPLCIDAYIRSGNYRRLRAELDALADRNAFSDTLSELFNLLGENDLLLQDCPDSFLSAYVRAHPDEAPRLLPNVGQSVWLEVAYPDTPMEDKHIYIPYLSASAAALSNDGIIATLLGNRIRLFDWNTRMYTAEYQLEETEDSPAFLYWKGETLIVRFARLRLRLLYADTQLHLETAEACPELPLMDFGDREAVDDAGGLRECEERGYASEMVFPYRAGKEVRHAELFYPLGAALRVYRHGILAAVLVENSFVDIVNLERNCLLRRLEFASAAYVRFSPDGSRLLLCHDDSAAFRFDVPAPDAAGIPLPGPSMPLGRYSRKYNMALMREKLSAMGILFAPTGDGELPVTSASRKAFLGDTSPLYACMSKEKDWLACYYYRRNAALVRLYKLSTLEACQECRVPPIFPRDAETGDPFRALDDGSGLELTSRGVTHVWRFQEKAWTHRKAPEHPPRTERGRHPTRRPSLSYAFMWLLLPEAWRYYGRLLRGETIPPVFPPIRLPDGDCLWELDRNAHRVSLLTKGGKPLCRVQLNRAVLTAAVRNGELYVFPENGAGEIVIRKRCLS